MIAFYKKLISMCVLLAIFLFGNMAIVHAVTESVDIEIISHSHDGITESHIVETTDNKEPPHCTQTKIDTSIIQQVRDIVDLSDIIKGGVSSYFDYGIRVEVISQDTYLQHYP